MNPLTLTNGQMNSRTHQLDTTGTAALMTDGKCYEWNGTTRLWELQASAFLRSSRLSSYGKTQAILIAAVARSR